MPLRSFCSAKSEKARSRKERLRGNEPSCHGTGQSYRVYHCRCDVCVSSERKRMRRPEVYAKERERCWAKYGIFGFSYDDFCKMFEEQNGKCEICSEEMKLKSNKKSEVANVDHDHDTGKIRSLLCGGCNKMIGFGTPDVLIRGAEYLKKHKEEDEL